MSSKQPNAVKIFLYYGLPASVVLVALIFGALEARQFLSESKQFSIDKINVVSTGGISADEVRASSGIRKGESIFRLDLERVRERLEKNPWIQSAIVTRVLPNEVQIRYEPQKVVALLGGESLYYLNEKGVPFFRLRKGDSLDYPLIQIEGGRAGEKFVQEKTVGALNILKELRGTEIFSESDLGDITVRMAQEEATYLFSLKFPPAKLSVSGSKKVSVYTASFGEEQVSEQVKHWSYSVRNMVQAGKSPRLIRLELGKKVVVKLQR